MEVLLELLILVKGHALMCGAILFLVFLPRSGCSSLFCVWSFGLWGGYGGTGCSGLRTEGEEKKKQSRTVLETQACSL